MQVLSFPFYNKCNKKTTPEASKAKILFIRDTTQISLSTGFASKATRLRFKIEPVLLSIYIFHLKSDGFIRE
jgi:hypothetical protein